MFKLAILNGSSFRKSSIFLLKPINENKIPKSISDQLFTEMDNPKSKDEKANIFLRKTKAVSRSIEKNTQPIITIKKI